MGLDTGIIITDKRLKEPTPSFVDFRMQIDSRTDVCYWRKCWGLTHDLAAILHCPENEQIKISAEDVPAIERVLWHYLDKEYWEEYGDSIWEYDEYKMNLRQNLKNLLWLGEYLKKYPETECYFYESF